MVKRNEAVFQFVILLYIDILRISPTEMNMRWRMETEQASTSQVW